jgi:hypothetical protein
MKMASYHSKILASITKEELIYKSAMVYGLCLFELGVLAFMQIVYFESQGERCMIIEP